MDISDYTYYLLLLFLLNKVTTLSSRFFWCPFRVKVQIKSDALGWRFLCEVSLGALELLQNSRPKNEICASIWQWFILSRASFFFWQLLRIFWLPIMLLAFRDSIWPRGICAIELSRLLDIFSWIACELDRFGYILIKCLVFGTHILFLVKHYFSTDDDTLPRSDIFESSSHVSSCGMFGRLVMPCFFILLVSMPSELFMGWYLIWDWLDPPLDSNLLR